MLNTPEFAISDQWRIQPGAGGPCPPPAGGLTIFFAMQYINIITKPTAYDEPREY